MSQRYIIFRPENVAVKEKMKNSHGRFETMGRKVIFFYIVNEVRGKVNGGGGSPESCFNTKEGRISWNF